MLKITDVKNNIQRNKLLWGIFLAALVLRLIGLAHGYPYIYNIDEPAIVRSSFGLRQGFRIDHFDWPHFPFYFNYAFYFIFIKFRALLQILGLREMLEMVFPILWNDPFIFYFISRFVSAVVGALTVIPVYLLSSKLFNNRVGLIAAALLAVIPYHIYSSKLALADVLLLFFLSYAVYFSYKFSENFRTRDIVLAALMYGISSGIKYNAILTAIILLIFIFNRLWLDKNLNLGYFFKNIFSKLVLFGLVSLFALVATTPSVFTDWDIFWSYDAGRGFLWQLFLNSNPMPANEYLPALWEKFSEVTLDMAVIPIIFFFLSLAIVLRKQFDRSQKLSLWALAVSAILIFLFTSRYSRSTSHYYISIYSFIIVVASWGVSELYNQIKNRAFYYVVFSLPVIWSLYTVFTFVVADTRDIAMNYYEASREEGTRAYYFGETMTEIHGINNTAMKYYKADTDFEPGDILITEKMLENDDKIMLIDTIDNSFRRGPIIYVYKKSI